MSSIRTKTEYSSSSDASTTSNDSPPTTSSLATAEKDYSIPIGVGVGLPLGIIAAGFVVYLILRYRRSQQQAPEPCEAHDPAINPTQPHFDFKPSTADREITSYSTPVISPTEYGQSDWASYVQEMPAEEHGCKGQELEG